MYNVLITGHLEKLWAYLHIKQLMDDYELNKNENSTAKAKALELALKVSSYSDLFLTMLLLLYFIFSIHLLHRLRH